MDISFQHLSRLQHGALSPGRGPYVPPPVAYRLQAGHQGHWQRLLPLGSSSQQVWGGVAQGQLLCGVAAQGPRAVGVAVGPHLERGAVASQAGRKPEQKQEAREEARSGEMTMLEFIAPYTTGCVRAGFMDLVFTYSIT